MRRRCTGARKQVARCQWMLRGLAAEASGEGPARSPDLPRAAATESVGVVFTGQVPVEQRWRTSQCGVSGQETSPVVVKGRSRRQESGGGGTGDSNVRESFFGGE